MARGDTLEPALGVPSLTPGEIDSIYREAFGRATEGNEMASELENANKYSAAAIERQIKNRASNAAGSGVRGDEGKPSLTIPRALPVTPPQNPFIYTTQPVPIGSLATVGPAGIERFADGPTVGPTGLAYTGDPVNYSNMTRSQSYGYNGDRSGVYDTAGSRDVATVPAVAGGGGNYMLYLILAGMAAAAYFLLRK